MIIQGEMIVKNISFFRKIIRNYDNNCYLYNMILYLTLVFLLWEIYKFQIINIKIFYANRIRPRPKLA